jgi:glycosyltransferase involved in cell wall biosynthesis
VSDRPLVSIALATFNGARYLREQLGTLYAQTWEPVEVVVSDDASTDGTVEILAEHARLRGLRYAVNAANLGLVKNFERSIGMCRGALIALCDQDDLWKPHKIATLVENLGDFSLIYCNGQEYLSVDGRIAIDTAVDQVFAFARAQGTGRPTRHLLAENWVVSHTLLFRREVLAAALPFPAHHVYHDGWLALVASKLGGIKYFDERLQTHRRHAASITFVPPAERVARHRSGRRLLDGTYRAAWQSRCRTEIARLGDAVALPLLDEDDRAFVRELLEYYRIAPRRGVSWRALRAGWRVAPYFSTLFGAPRWRAPLRALAGGL